MRNIVVKKKSLIYIAIYLLFSPLVAILSVSYSRDYLTYVDLISKNESPDLFLESISYVFMEIGLSPEYIYMLYVAFGVYMLFYFFCKRNISIYWMTIYFLNFGLLHILTQVRAGMATLLIAIAITSTSRFVNLLTISAPLVHSSAAIFSGIGLSRKPIYIYLLTILPLISVPLVLLYSDKLYSYSLEINESQFISIAFVSYLSLIILSFFLRIDLEKKKIFLAMAVTTIILYFIFIDFKAVSNRFVER